MAFTRNSLRFIGLVQFLYTKLSTVLYKEALFYSCILPFIAFFGAFAFVLYL
ncbi:hypothetical protein AMTRI_Chr09g38640 [Amborella trichopoda]